MKITKEMAEATPTCACGGYVEAGDTLKAVAGTCNDRPAWWVECPDCGRALGAAHLDPPKNKHAQALGRLGAGIKKQLTAEEIERKRERLTVQRLKRWPKCEKCGQNSARELHPCPYLVDVENDRTKMCNCCDSCAKQCAEDV